MNARTADQDAILEQRFCHILFLQSGIMGRASSPLEGTKCSISFEHPA